MDRLEISYEEAQLLDALLFIYKAKEPKLDALKDKISLFIAPKTIKTRVGKVYCGCKYFEDKIIQKGKHTSTHTRWGERCGKHKKEYSSGILHI